MNYSETVQRLRALANRKNVAGMARFGINPAGTLGVSMPEIRRLAREIGRDQGLAEKLYDSGIHEARILAGLVAEPKKVTTETMERWVSSFDSWDMCDQVCMNLFDRTPHAYGKASEWAVRPEEFVKRAGFAIMASLAAHDKKAGDESFIPFLGLIEREAGDGRNFVKKAVNWALRQIGKRNSALNRLALQCAERIARQDAPSSCWIAADAIRELASPRVQERIKKRRNG